MANCRGCNAPIMWAITQEGKRAPLDPVATTGGNVLVWRTTLPIEPRNDSTMRCVTLAGDTLADLVALGVPLRTSHFVTCPVADRFRPDAEPAATA